MNDDWNGALMFKEIVEGAIAVHERKEKEWFCGKLDSKFQDLETIQDRQHVQLRRETLKIAQGHTNRLTEIEKSIRELKLEVEELKKSTVDIPRLLGKFNDLLTSLEVLARQSRTNGGSDLTKTARKLTDE